MNLPKNLPRGVYAVGGFTRDTVRAAIRAHGIAISTHELEQAMRSGAADGDVDLCGVLTAQELTAALGAECVDVVNARTGTAWIRHGARTYEYTRFREEVYAPDGSHEPLSVVFHDDIARDARRRDFACNAIYYEPSTGRLFDPVGGIEDVKRGVLRAVDGEATLRYDGLRILRLVRFAATCELAPDESTEALARRYVHLLNAIPGERIYKELVGMLTPLTARRAVSMMTDYGITALWTKTPVTEFPCVFCAKTYVLPAFFADLAHHDEVAVRALCKKLCATNRVCEQAVAICRALDASVHPSALSAHFSVVTDATGWDGRVQAYLEKAAQSNAPRCVAEMQVDGRDCLALGIKGQAVGRALAFLQARCVDEGIPNDRERLLALLKEYV